MCGIAGIHYKHPVDPAVLDRAQAHFGRALAHRGPDHYGVHRSARSLLCNLRLAIVDRAGGQQPIYTPDRRHGIVYNGEVYNHEALRPAGYPLRTSSDTEVLLATWATQGPRAFEHWNGMFAACLFDVRPEGSEGSDALTLVRDRFGQKPLYIYEDEHCIAFASELRTLLGLEGLDHALNPIGFQDYLAYRYNLAPHTMFARIEKLPAGCFTTWRNGRRQTLRYASVVVSEPQATRSEADYAEELDGLLARSVRSQLMGEVPIGVLLSGGLDSSAVASYVHQAGARLKAYSIGLPEVNEFAYSRAVARQFDLDYVELCITQPELRAGMDRVIAELDEPIADPACFALSRLAQRIADDVTVVLSGEGGDELFAGYDQHQLALKPELAADRDKLFTHFFLLSSNDLKANELMREKKRPLHHTRYRPVFDDAPSALAGMQAFELSCWMPENLMMKADKILMAHSLEGRFPFLDLDVWRYASALPREMKLPRVESSKHVLRALMKTRLPRSVIERQKMGFTVPPVYLLEPMRPRLEGAIEQLRGTPLADVLDFDAILGVLADYYGGNPKYFLRVWNLAVLLLWWVDVYPTLQPRPVPEPMAVEPAPVVATTVEPQPGPQPKAGRLVVYTVLVGAKEQLNDPLETLPAGATSDLDIDWVCITDNPVLTSKTWRLQPLGDRHLPAEKLSRRPKALPHEYFPGVAHSLYVDNTVTFRRLPQASDLQHDTASADHLFRAFLHGSRRNPDEEAAAVASLAYDAVDTVAAQMAFYAKQRPLASITPLTTATVLLRSHHHPAVRRFGQLWWESILAFSKRDQLSFDYARLESNVTIDWWPGTTEKNDLVHWHGGLGRKRVQANFDAQRYAWLHRDDPAAVADPRGHYLAHAPAGDTRYARELPVMAYACWRTGSSLGDQVSPRRGMAQALEDLIARSLQPGQRALIVRVQDSPAARAFSTDELDRATQALAMLLGKHQCPGTVLDLNAADFAPDGRIYTTDQAPYALVLLLGLPGEQFAAAARKLQRLLDPSRGALVAALTSPVSLADAADAEALVTGSLDASVSTALHASRHDDQRAALPNTVVGLSWTAAPKTPMTPSSTTAREAAA